MKHLVLILICRMCMELEPCGTIGDWHKHGQPGMFLYENLILITEKGCQVVEGLPRMHLEVSCYK
jgi:hypothetical protein